MQAFGKYTLLKRLATGGMAEVWLARQTSIQGFEKKLVIKRILPKFAGDREFREMFLNEARIAAQFSHPNVVQIYDLGEVAGTYYIAMEFVHGLDLGRIVRQARSINKLVPQHIAIRIIALSCEGLYYAHTRTDDAGRPLKVVHRDISPQNILVGFDGSVKVVDFGIAKAADSAAMTKSGFIKGKLSYMAAEQATSKSIDHRVDIFALGLTLYEVLTNTRPLKRDSDAATFRAALECNIPPLTRVAPWIPRDLEPIVMRALAKDREQRYPDARQFGMALEEFLAARQQLAGSIQISEMMSALFAETPSLPAYAPPSPAGVPKRVVSEPPVVNDRRDPVGPWAPGTPIGSGGKYIIRRHLGDGVMTEVYLCSARGAAGYEKNVAIKRPHRDLENDAAFVESFVREARQVAELKHRNVVQIHDFDRHGSVPFYAMEYVRGRSLGDVFRRGQAAGKPISPVLAARIGEEVARGLSYAHQKNTVHRNVSPANVLLSFDGSVKLADFGSATSGASKEKLGYLSPEEARGEFIDARADLFSLGVVLWELLAGRRLFEAGSPADVRSAVESRAIDPPAQLAPGVPEELNVLVMKALARESQYRLQSAGELSLALRRVVADHVRSPEESDLARYLHGLYGGEIAREAERDVDPSPTEAETTTAISPEELTASMRSSGEDEDTDLIHR